VPLAAPGPSLIPAARGSIPGWLLGIFGGGFGLDGAAYLAVLVGAFLCYMAVVASAASVGRRILWAVIVGLLGLFVLAPPLLSQDVFSYIAYGRLAARHGLDPYVAVPADRPEDPVVPFVGWRFTPSTYGPAFTLATYPLGLVGVATALWALKVVAGLAVLGLAVITAHIASVRGGDPQRAAAVVALNPIVLAHVVGGAHNDAVMVVVLMASVALVSGRELFGGAGVVMAFAVKASALFVAPFAVAGSSRRLRLVAGMAVAAACVTAVATLVFGAGISGIARAISHNQQLSSRYSGPAIVSRLTSLPLDAVRAAALVGYGAGALGLLGWTIRGADWLRAAGWAALGLLIATSWLMPWYVIWLLPFAAVGRDRYLLGATFALCAFQLVNRIPL
jgi:hypothetical protein